MQVALVHDWLTGMRGGEKCLEVFCREFPQAPLYTLLHAPGSVAGPIVERPIVTSGLQHVPGIRRTYRYFLPLMPRAIESLRLPRELDLVLSCSHAVAKSVLPPPGVPHVCYCFTPMRYAWHLRDDYFQRSAAPRRSARAPLHWLRDALLDRVRRWDRETSHRVTHFVAISQTVARRIQQCYDRDSTVIYPPVDTEFYTPVVGPREDYYLCVSALVPYKRIDLAIAACNRLRRPLVVIGQGPELARLRRLAGPTIALLGWRSDVEIREHLRRCKAFLFPGQEDFGIAPLEAQACGAPVVAYARGGALETVVAAGPQGPGTGVFFDEQTVESLAAAIGRLEADPRQCSASRARRQAERFALDRFEREIRAYLRDVLSGADLRRAAA